MAHHQQDGRHQGVTLDALCRADEVPEAGGRGFRRGALAFFVVRKDGALYAYANSCPHIGTPLDWVPDRFFERRGEKLLCATHGALFRPQDGECVAGPCFGRRLAPVAIQIVDETIFLDLP
jgi:nitrite reductase/ring-hydroxylating ferredoxin subunit